MFCKMNCMALRGIDAAEVTVEVDVGNGMPGINLVGLLSPEVREAKDRVRVALKNCGYPMPAKKITVNLSPADMRKEGTAFDLAIAAGVLCCLEFIPAELTKKVCFIGELGLNGELRPVPGVISYTLAATEAGMESIIVPKDNAQEAAMADGIRVYAASDLNEVIEFFTGIKEPEAVIREERTEPERKTEDFSDIRGQYLAKRAALIAAAGGHNLLLVGPPGSGKTMLAKRIPGILPALSVRESMELTKIYSVAGLFHAENGPIRVRPFRNPHHTCSGPGMAGGGARQPVPGEITLASNGVLFLDELPEFKRECIEALRQPLEEHKAVISRLYGNYEFPASFLLIAAMNPCPCGYFPDRNRCNCSQDKIRRYLGRISQAVLDRIDLCVELSGVPIGELQSGKTGATSAELRAMVEECRRIQAERFSAEPFTQNALIPSSLLPKYCMMTDAAYGKLTGAFVKKHFSARLYDRIRRVARTIADLDKKDIIEENHVSEAILYHAMEGVLSGNYG